METVEALICSVERLLGRLPAGTDSEMSRLRLQAKNALTAAKAALASDAARPAGKISPLPLAYLDARLREWPGTALTVTAIVGLAIGFWTCRTAYRRPRRS
jgi:ElaB/YqjD/DUF883 family membrane-anchored ribosome-binding protein